MSELTSPMGVGATDEYVMAFEAAWSDGGHPDLAGFLPPPGDPLYPRVVRELVRVDLEFGWGLDRPRPLDDYRREFPDVFADSAALGEIAYEEFRQRREHGEQATREEYAGRYGVSTDGWPEPGGPAPEVSPTVVADRDLGLHAASLAYRQFRSIDPLRGCPTAAAFDPPGAVPTQAADLFRAVHRADPAAADRLAEATATLPEVGDEFLGFRLVGELGRGAFGRVYLAHQGDLADRPVALKVSAELLGESQTLAQLQHTNIVPIYSVHRSGPFQALCMPYLGGTTLSDVVRGLRDAPSLPASGRHLVSTLHDRRSRTVAGNPFSPPSVTGGQATKPPVTDGGLNEPLSSSAAVSRTLLDKLEGLSYVEAVLWLGARLADGLAHAHERGVVHRDLKPANVLLTDDGQPMLLDFNLSDDQLLRGSAPAAQVGGTLPYMPPEQLEAFQHGKAAPADPRGDLYSLGVILYELLTGRFPFPSRAGLLHVSLPQMALDRHQPAPRLCPLNPAVSPAAESIVRRCLAPDLAARYQTAGQLREDLERQLADLPLRHAPEPSARERFRKWTRRHPRLASSTTVAAAAGLLFLAAAGGALAFWRQHQLGLAAAEREHDRLAAADGLSRVGRAKLAQQALLNYPDRAAAAAVGELSRAALADYAVLDDAAWLGRPLADRLPPGDRDRLRADVAEMLLTWAGAEERRAQLDPDHRPEQLALAGRLAERAELCLGGESRSVALRRAALAGLLNRPEAAELAARAAKLSPQTAGEHFDQAREHLRKREFKRALPHLQETTRLDHRHFWAWHLLGNCHFELLQFPEAIACYTACVGLTPDSSVAYFPYYHRGVVYAARGRDLEAEADFDRAAAALPDLSPDLRPKERPRLAVERAKLLARRKQFAAAEAVLTEALGPQATDTLLLLERSRVRNQRGDQDGAGTDRAEALRREPADEVGWNLRGLARLPGDPQGALADFDRALRLNPGYYPALQNTANALAEHLNQPAEAVAVLDRAIEQYPGYVQARIGRAVLLARLGKRAEAHADVLESLARDRSGPTLYQAANVYALTSRQESADRDRVIPLLAAALWNGFGLDVIDGDADMDPVRGQPGFKRLVEVVREFQAEARRKGL